MMQRLSSLREIATEQAIRRKVLLSKIADYEQSLSVAKLELTELTRAGIILRETAKGTQKRFKEYIERLVTLALQAVLHRYRFKLKFRDKRGKPICELRIMDGGHVLDPKDDVGFGAIDVCAYVLIIAMLTLTHPRLRPVIILDDPMRNIGVKDDARRAARMIKMLSRKVGVQVIIATHNENFIEAGDRVWEFTHNGVHTVSRLLVDRWDERRDSRYHKRG